MRRTDREVADVQKMKVILDRCKIVSYAMWDGEKPAGSVDGMVTNQADLTDELYAQAALHDESGAWQMIFGVNTLPACRRQGIAETLLRRAIADAGGWC